MKDTLQAIVGLMVLAPILFASAFVLIPLISLLFVIVLPISIGKILWDQFGSRRSKQQ
jgi:hypothetical protein